MSCMQYRCEARSVEAFLSQICRYVGGGHYFYFACTLGEDKDPCVLDRKMVDRYVTEGKAWRRKSRSRGGHANVHYLRCGRFYVLISTHGKKVGGKPEKLFFDHATTIRDIRRKALTFWKYSIRYTFSETEKRWKVNIRLHREAYQELRAELVQFSVRERCRDSEAMEEKVRSLRLAWYRPVRAQVFRILQEVNRRRRYRGFDQIPATCIPKMRRPPIVFIEDAVAEDVPVAAASAYARE